MSLHTGAHLDAPSHFARGGATLEQIALDVFVGPARVIDARGRDPIAAELLDPRGGAVPPRVLVRTDCWPDRSRFPERIPTLAQDAPARLGELGVLLFGIDLPSVDAIDSTDLPIHHALHAAGVRILEGICLQAVEPGDYWLCALPLAMARADASPVRAVLLRGVTRE
jgi:arylformamidase